jgi:hypothetical protein
MFENVATLNVFYNIIVQIDFLDGLRLPVEGRDELFLVSLENRAG